MVRYASELIRQEIHGEQKEALQRVVCTRGGRTSSNNERDEQGQLAA